MSDTSRLSQSPTRGLSGFALMRNRAGEVLLIEKKNPRGAHGRWGLPGGSARQGEEAPLACQRQVLAQTGLHILPDRLLVVHHMPAQGQALEETSHVFDGELTTGKVILAEDLASSRWVRPDAVGSIVVPHIELRITCALNTVSGAPARYLCGHPKDWRTLAA